MEDMDDLPMKARKRPEPRTIRPRSTFPVYLPVDVSPELCDFLNALKDKGNFSADIISILSQYIVLRKHLYPNADVSEIVDLANAVLTNPGSKMGIVAVQSNLDFNESNHPEQAVLSQDVTNGPGFSLNRELLRQARRSRQLGSVLPHGAQ